MGLLCTCRSCSALLRPTGGMFTGQEGAIRLTDGGTPDNATAGVGVLEIFHAGAWGTVCVEGVQRGPFANRLPEVRIPGQRCSRTARRGRLAAAWFVESYSASYPALVPCECDIR